MAGLRTEADHERVGRELRGTFLSAAMFEGGDTPWLTPKVLGQMGFAQVSYPATLVFRMVATLRATLADLRRHALDQGLLAPLADAPAARRALDEALGLEGWRRIERELGGG